MKVWIVTEGEYSDYRISAVFSSPELARQYCERYKLREADYVEEWEVDAPETLKPHIRVGMFDNGDVLYVQPSDRPAGLYYCGGNQLTWIVETDSPEHAIKVTNEKRIQIIAAEAWGNMARLEQLGLSPKPPGEGKS